MGIGRAGGEVMWPRVYGRRDPCRRGCEGQKGLSPPWEIPWRARARSGLASGPAGRAAVPSGARTGRDRVSTRQRGGGKGVRGIR
jgi:hypothetical protein